MNFHIRAASALIAISLPFGAAASEVVTSPDLSVQSSGSLPVTSSGPEDQSIHPNLNTPGDQTVEQTSLPISPAPTTGFFPQFGKQLLDIGIDLHGTMADHFLANPTAGVNPGNTINLAALRPAADFDLDRLIGLPGGYIHVGLTFFGLRSDIPQSITQTDGFLTGFQTTPATETDIISLLTYEQRFINGRLSVEAGRSNLFNYFFLPNSLDPFTYYSGALVSTSDAPSAPYPTWGGRATYKLDQQWYVQTGAFEDNFIAATQYGDRFGTGDAPGAQLLAEIGQRNDFRSSAYPSNLEVGMEWNTRSGRSNIKGTGAPAIPFLAPTDYSGGGVLYLQGQKVIWRGAARPGARILPPANIALFGSIDASVDKPQPVDVDVLTGLNFTGFLPGRPLDALGLQFRYQRLSQVEAMNESRLQLETAGPGPSQPRDGYQFEAVGNIQVMPAVAFRPIFEYFINPDNLYPPGAVPGRPHDGVEAGFFAVVSLGRLLGTSIKPN